jgi:hypothetical protein
MEDERQTLFRREKQNQSAKNEKMIDLYSIL